MFDLITNIDIATEEACDNIMESVLLSYDKMANIMRYDDNIDLDNFAIFQEGKIMDDVKERGKGQSKLKKIITFIPRLIMSIINFLKNKFLKKKDKNKLSEINKAIKDPKKFGVLKALLAGAGTGVAVGAVGTTKLLKPKDMLKDIKDLEDQISEFGKTIDDLKSENDSKNKTIDEKDKKIKNLEEDLEKAESYGKDEHKAHVHAVYREKVKEQIISLVEAVNELDKRYCGSISNIVELENGEKLNDELQFLRDKIYAYHYQNKNVKEMLEVVGEESKRKYYHLFNKFESLYRSLTDSIISANIEKKNAEFVKKTNVKIDGNSLKIKTNIKAVIKSINMYNEKMEEFFKSGKISKVSLLNISADENAYEFVDSEEIEKILYEENISKLYDSLGKAKALGEKFYDEYISYSEEYDGSIKKSKLSGDEDKDDELQEFFGKFVSGYTTIAHDMKKSLDALEKICNEVTFIIINDYDNAIKAMNLQQNASREHMNTSFIYNDIKDKHNTKVKELRERDKEKKED